MRLPSPLITRIVPTALTLSVATMILSACISLERFRHEKYSCTPNRAGLNELIIRHAKTGADVKIIAGGKDTSGQITAISDEQASISYETIELTVNRKTGIIMLADRNRYYRLNCSVSVFTL